MIHNESINTSSVNNSESSQPLKAHNSNTLTTVAFLLNDIVQTEWLNLNGIGAVLISIISRIAYLNNTFSKIKHILRYLKLHSETHTARGTYNLKTESIKTLVNLIYLYHIVYMIWSRYLVG